MSNGIGTYSTSTGTDSTGISTGISTNGTSAGNDDIGTGTNHTDTRS